MGVLRRTALHYVRCIKPNDGMAALAFDQPRVLEQLRCAGLLEVVRLRQLGCTSAGIRTAASCISSLRWDSNTAAVCTWQPAVLPT
eukprot:1906122-Prymnesium_polylepis.1